MSFFSVLIAIHMCTDLLYCMVCISGRCICLLGEMFSFVQIDSRYPVRACVQHSNTMLLIIPFMHSCIYWMLPVLRIFSI
jgi:hypothetical protein